MADRSGKHVDGEGRTIDVALTPTPTAIRLYRCARVAVHLCEGLATTALVFPFSNLPRRHALISHWSKRLLAMLRVELRIEGMPRGGLPGNLLIVSNHVSWLDIFALNALQPARFIGKAELKRWPVMGQLIAGCGTLFIERERRRDAHRVNERARDALKAGDTIAIFPEGTTTDGAGVLPFHGSLLQPVIDADGHLQPIAIRYRGTDGVRSDAAAYVGDTTFMASFWSVLGKRELIAELTVTPSLRAAGSHRRELARAAESAIRQVLGSLASGSAPGTRDGRPAGLP